MWTEATDQKLNRLWEAGSDLAKISLALNTSEADCYQRLCHLGKVGKHKRRNPLEQVCKTEVWNQHKDTTLLQMWDEGTTLKDISFAINMSVEKCYERLQSTGKIWTVDKEFWSDGALNKLSSEMECNQVCCSTAVQSPRRKKRKRSFARRGDALN